MTGTSMGLDFQTALWWGWVVLAAFVAAGAMAWLYRRLFGLYGRRSAIVLLSLKTAAAVLLLVGLLRPAFIHEKKDLSNARIILLVDDSRSMSTCDASLGASRLEEAQRVAFKKVLPRLKDELPVTTLAFSDRVRAIDSADELKGAGEATEIPNALLESARNYAGGGRVGAYVLVTDGGDAQALSPALSLNVPVFSLAIGSDLSKTDDLRVARVEHPDRVDVKTEFEVTVEVAASGSQSFFKSFGTLSLKLTEGEKPITAKPVRLSRDTSRRTIKFRVQADEPGIHRYTLSLPTFKSEAATLNNKRTFTLEVESPSLRVLYYASRLGQGYKAFRNAVKSDPGIHFTGLVRLDQDRFLLQGKRPGDTIKDAFPSSLEMLRKFKCIVLAGCQAQDISPEAHASLRKYISEGGSLVVMGGPKAFGRGGWARSPIAPAMPWQIADSEPAFREQKVGVEVTPLGRAHQIFRGLSTSLRPGEAWASLNGYNLPGSLRAGAQSLAQMQLASGERPAVIAGSRYGKGKVLGVATNALWKWSQGGQEQRRLYNGFWRQAVRFLGGRAEDGGLLKLTADRNGRYPAGSRATVTARVLDRALKPLKQATLNASLKRMDGTTVCPVNFRPGAQPGAFNAQIDLAGEGAYRLQVSASDSKGLLESGEILLEVGARPGEGARLAVNTSYLEALAAKTGGAAMPARDAAKLVRQVVDGVQAEVKREEFSLLWDRPYFFILFLGLLTAEWVARRRMNLI